MASSNSPLFHLLLSLVALLMVSATSQHETSSERGRGTEKRVGRRVLMSFRETPRGGNTTFDCSPSGPCVPCLFSEKNNEKYRCSETGYRIPLKCVEIEDGSKEASSKKSKNSRSVLENPYNKAKLHVMLNYVEEIASSIRHRSLLDDSSTLKGPQAYITYRSCIPPVNEEKLSVFGFEGIMLCLLLISGSVVYFRRKQTIAMSGVGAVRIQANSRF